MTTGVLAVLGVLLFGWAVLSGALARHNVTGPLVFTFVGFALGNRDWGVLALDVNTSVIHGVAEATRRSCCSRTPPGSTAPRSATTSPCRCAFSSSGSR